MDNKSKICPYLGLVDDCYTYTSYPSQWNCCHYSNIVSAIELTHQSEFCLMENYQKCPVILRKKKSIQPDRVFENKDKHSNPRIIRREKIIVISILFILVLAFGMLRLSNSFSIPVTGESSFRQISSDDVPAVNTGSYTGTQSILNKLSDSPGTGGLSNQTNTSDSLSQINSLLPIMSTTSFSATEIPGLDLFLSVTSTAQIINSASQEVTPTTKNIQTSQSPIPSIPPTSTSKLTPTARLVLRELDYLIGKEDKFIIHQIKNGESLNYYADRYKTSLEAILKVNYSLFLPLWVGSFIVIPVNFSDVSAMPYFQPYRLMTNAMTVDSLAKELGTDLNQFIFYNGFQIDEVVQLRDWVLVPRPYPAK